MNKSDQSIVEEIRAYLGLDAHDRKDEQRLALGSQHVRSYIDDMFGLKAAKMPHPDAIVTAFTKTHHNMYLDDPAFATTFKKEMTARGIPKPEIEKALDEAEKVLDLVFKEFGSKQEKDGGIHPNWDGIEEVSKPGQPDNGGLVNSNELGQFDGNIKSDLPINRKKATNRQKPVMEAWHQGVSNNAKSYKSGWDVETPYGLAYIEGEIFFDLEPAEPATRDYPGSPGGIDVYDTKMHVVEIYGEGDQMISVKDPEMLDGIKQHFDHFAGSDDMEVEIGEYLHNEEEAGKQQAYDERRDRMRGL